MSTIRLHEGELNVMEMLWSNQSLPAKDIAKIIKDYIGWEKNTTYTVIKRLIDKGAVKRVDPGFICKEKKKKKEVQQIETDALIDKVFSGSLTEFIDSYLGQKKLTSDEMLHLRKVIEAQYKNMF